MKILIIITSVFFFTLSLVGQAIQIKEYDKMSTLLDRVKNESDTTYVINFWATWCKPCVKEMPLLLEVENGMKGKPVKFIYASLDFKNQFKTRLVPFVEKNMPTSEVVHFTDSDANSWISQISEDWTGAIPATVVVRQKHIKNFIEGEFHSKKEVEEFIQTK